MPTVQVEAGAFHAAIGQLIGCPKFDLDDFAQKLDAACFEMGLEFDGVDEETKRLRIEVGANRYDLLCIEGLVDAFRAFKDPLGNGFVEYKHSCAPQITMTVEGSTAGVRPYVVGCVFRDVKFDDASFKSFIDLQDKLHQNLCRRRTLVAIGTHDLDKLTAPFCYKALPKRGGFKFMPLKITDAEWTKEVDPEQMFEMLQKTYLKSYLPIISESPLTPVIMDSKNKVLSVPPIINADHCKLTHETTNIFVEITSVDNRKSEIVLDQIVAFMGRKLKEPFTVEPIRVIYKDGHPGYPLRGQNRVEAEYLREIVVPRLNLDVFNVSVQYSRTLIGLPELTAAKICELLPRLMLKAEIVDEENVKVTCPINRRDVLHACDVVEDVAIAYGYNNLNIQSKHAVALQSIQNVSERVRRSCAMAGWKECLTFGLISMEDAFALIRRKPSAVSDVSVPFWREKIRPCVVSEPKSRECEVVRPTLIPGVLRTLASNQHAELPIRLFEIGDVVVADESRDNQAKQMRRLAAIMADSDRSGFEEIHGLLDFVLKTLHLTPVYAAPERKAVARRLYRLRPIEDGAFLPGRSVQVEVFEKDQEAAAILIGIMGVVHPEVLGHLGLTLPCSMFEIVLDPFLGWLQETQMSAP